MFQDWLDGIVSIKGNVDSFAYFDNVKKGTKSSLFDKLFKWYLMNRFFLFCFLLYGGLFTAFYLSFLKDIWCILDIRLFLMLFLVFWWCFCFLWVCFLLIIVFYIFIYFYFLYLVFVYLGMYLDTYSVKYILFLSSLLNFNS